MRRSDVEEGRVVYTCNCGWFDVGHATQTDGGPTIGAIGLWNQIKSDPPLPAVGQRDSLSARTVTPTMAGPEAELTPDDGFVVETRQRSGLSPGGVWVVSQGVTLRYLVRRDLTRAERKSVALAIFMAISVHFEQLQFDAASQMVMHSGFSVEDLVSDLIGFYVAIGEVSPNDIGTLCGQVTREQSLAIFDQDPDSHSGTNTTFDPVFATNTLVDTRDPAQRAWALVVDLAGIAADPGPVDPCKAQPRKFPAEFRAIAPAKEGSLFRQTSDATDFRIFPTVPRPW